MHRATPVPGQCAESRRDRLRECGEMHIEHGAESRGWKSRGSLLRHWWRGVCYWPVGVFHRHVASVEDALLTEAVVHLSGTSLFRPGARFERPRGEQYMGRLYGLPDILTSSTNYYKGFNVAGTVDWAVDLSAFTDDDRNPDSG